MWKPLPGPQTDAYYSEADELFYGGAAGGGKLLALDTEIATLQGWTTMGEVKVGDTVFGGNGLPCRVVAVSNIQLDTTYKLLFSDDTEIIAGASHQWITETQKDRDSYYKCTDAYRSQRRDNRPSKVSGTKSGIFTASLQARNSARKHQHKEPNVPTVKTTQEIVDSLYTVGRRVAVNHSIPTCAPLETSQTETSLLVPPYVLGAWLGDGSTSSGAITGIDDEILDEIRQSGYTLTSRASKITHGILGLQVELREIGVLDNKHIPMSYLRASTPCRLAILQGLMDTDGYCDPRGQCEYVTTNETLARNVHDLICSLGIKVAISTGRAMLYGKDCGTKYRLKFLTELPAFRLSRKLDKQKRNDFRGTHNRRYIISATQLSPVPMRCIAVDSADHTYLVTRSFIVTHNTHLALGLAITQHENAIIFRREYKQLRDIIRDSHKLLDGKANWNGSDLTWSGIPGGRLIDFGAVQHTGKQVGWMGRPHDLIVLDEGSQLPEATYLFLTGWLRTTTPSQRTRVLLCSNPPTTGDGEWVIRRWAPWLDATYPNPALPGELRWFARPDDVDTEVSGPEPFEYKNARGIVEILHPRSRTFIPAHLSDNPYLNADDQYLATLQGLPEPLRSQLLYGDFSIGLKDDPWQVIPTAWIKAAMARWDEWAEAGKPGHFEGMGVDVGRHHDKTVFAMRYGNSIDELRRYAQQSTMAAVGLIAGILTANPTAYCNPDETGVGTGLVDRLYELGYRKQVQPFVAGAKTERRTKDGTLGFANRRSMAWWNLRELLDPDASTEPIILPDDPELLGDLCALRYNIASDGKIQVEAKEKTIEKLGRSPDAGDAVMQAFAPPEFRGSFIV